MLGGGHEPGIDRYIGIDLDAADPEAEGFEQLQPIRLEPSSHPEIACVGITDQARGRGNDALPNPCHPLAHGKIGAFFCRDWGQNTRNDTAGN